MILSILKRIIRKLRIWYLGKIQRSDDGSFRGTNWNKSPTLNMWVSSCKSLELKPFIGGLLPMQERNQFKSLVWKYPWNTFPSTAPLASWSSLGYQRCEADGRNFINSSSPELLLSVNRGVTIWIFLWLDEAEDWGSYWHFVLSSKMSWEFKKYRWTPKREILPCNEDTILSILHNRDP